MLFGLSLANGFAAKWIPAGPRQPVDGPAGKENGRIVFAYVSYDDPAPVPPRFLNARGSPSALSLIAVILALVIGGSLGLVGGGGSILTVPALVFALGFAPRAAVAASLVVVGVTGGAGAFSHWRLGTLSPRVALVFGALGAVGAAIGSRVGNHLPGEWLMLGFTGVTLVAGIAMLRKSRSAPKANLAHPPRHRAIVAGSALGVGFLTGLFGVGGGFLIVPALVLAVGLPMPTAVGTSLAVIAANCAAGLIGSWHAISAPQLPVIATFTLLSVSGSVLGARAAHRTRPALLRRVFGALVLVVGLYTGVRSIAALLAP